MTSYFDRADAAERDLKKWLTAYAEAGVPELVLLTLLREQANEFETLGYVPRSASTTDANKQTPLRRTR